MAGRRLLATGSHTVLTTSAGTSALMRSMSAIANLCLSMSAIAASEQACVKWQAGSGFTATAIVSHTSRKPAVARPQRSASMPAWM